MGVQALSSTESEILQITESFKELLWLRPLLINLGFPSIECTTQIHTDNIPAEQILMNSPAHAARTKHMDIKVTFCGEVLAKRNKILLKNAPTPTKLNFADIFTKPLSTFQRFKVYCDP